MEKMFLKILKENIDAYIDTNNRRIGVADYKVFNDDSAATIR
ncbi:MAG: hypothetical protein ACOX3P_05870 [Saccharofermentanales bacterium]|jgi:hypothetical protein|nr:hypothetical protein [Bacillota bacterium]